MGRDAQSKPQPQPLTKNEAQTVPPINEAPAVIVRSLKGLQGYDSFFYPTAKKKASRPHLRKDNHWKGAPSVLTPGPRLGWNPTFFGCPDPFCASSQQESAAFDKKMSDPKKQARILKRAARRAPYPAQWPSTRTSRRDRFGSPRELQYGKYVFGKRPHLYPSSQSVKRASLAAEAKQDRAVFKREAPGHETPKRLRQFQSDNGMKWAILRPCSYEDQVFAEGVFPIPQRKRRCGRTIADLPEEKRPFMRVLLLADAGMSEREIGDVMGITRKRIRIMKKVAGQKLFWISNQQVETATGAKNDSCSALTREVPRRIPARTILSSNSARKGHFFYPMSINGRR
jgi:hypothetical protein